MIYLSWINTQEWIRLKFFQIIFFLAFLFVLFSYLLGSLSFAEQQRLLIDLGLATIEISLIFISAFFSTHSLHRDIERKTILLLLSRPLPRWKIIGAYFLSLATLNFVSLVVLGFTLYLIIDSLNQSFSFILSLIVIFLKASVIASFGFLFSVLSRPMISFVLTITYWLASYSIQDVLYFVKKMNDQSSFFLIFEKSARYIFPQFYLYNWKNYSFVKSIPMVSDIQLASFQLVSWIMLFLILTSLAFQRKEIV